MLKNGGIASFIFGGVIAVGDVVQFRSISTDVGRWRPAVASVLIESSEKQIFEHPHGSWIGCVFDAR
jgi:hypothetical protein